MNKYYIILSIILSSFQLISQDFSLDTNKISYTKSDSLIFLKLTLSFNNQIKDSNYIIEIASSFIDTKYGSGSRGKQSENKILINLSELDCVTFVENVLAIYKTINNEKYDFNTFINEIENVKYRNGTKVLFTSRLHYFTEWLVDNSLRSNINNKSCDIDTILYDKKINFMTKNVNLYPQLKDTAFYNEMILVEDNLNKNKLCYLLKNKFDEYKNKIKNGDIVVFTTSIEGLDVSHVGFAYWKNSELYLLHASSKYKKVIISPTSLKEYLNQNSKVTGIMIAEII